MLIRVGARPSCLALRQVEEVQAQIPDINFKVIPILTKGDQDKTTPLILRENSIFFTYEIEQALLRGEIDTAIHSAKDLEENIPDELSIAAMTKSISRFDCFVSRFGYALDTIPAGSIIGTSSRSRKEGIKGYRKDLIIKSIRGNVDERLEQLDRGEFDAIIVAHAALIRLGSSERIASIIPFNIINPHPLQGRLAIQILKKRQDLKRIFERLHEK